MPADPFVLMIAGPNGSGKTTLTQHLRRQGVDFGEYINPDDIAEELSDTPVSRSLRAQKIADERRDRCISMQASFSFETVMSHPSKVDVLARAKDAGFFVQLFFVGTDDPMTNVERVALRVALGGHDVPADRIIARWSRSMVLLADALRISDRAYLFDNSATADDIAAAPRLVLQKTGPTPRNSFRVVGGSSPVAEFRLFQPIPAWVRDYAAKPLGLTN